MAYKQSWGVSRMSVVEGSPLYRGIEPKVDTSPDSSEDIIESNNNSASINVIDDKVEHIRNNLNEHVEEEPKREKGKVEKFLDGTNTALTLGGFTPGWGAFADGANFLMSGARTLTNFVGDTARGISGKGWDYSRTGERLKDTGWALGGVVPILGQGVSTVKLGKGVKDTLNVAKAIKNTKAYKAVNIAKAAHMVAPDSTKVSSDNINTNERSLAFANPSDTTNRIFPKKQLKKV